MKVSPMDAHILTIDDDPAMRKLVADYLGGNDLRVVLDLHLAGHAFAAPYRS